LLKGTWEGDTICWIARFSANEGKKKKKNPGNNQKPQKKKKKKKKKPPFPPHKKRVPKEAKKKRKRRTPKIRLILRETRWIILQKGLSGGKGNGGSRRSRKGQKRWTQVDILLPSWEKKEGAARRDTLNPKRKRRYCVFYVDRKRTAQFFGQGNEKKEGTKLRQQGWNAWKRKEAERRTLTSSEGVPSEERKEEASDTNKKRTENLQGDRARARYTFLPERGELPF